LHHFKTFPILYNMRLIDRKDIERWADQFDSKGNFPLLISRLVHASTPVGTFVDFPSGSTVFTSSWDGLVNCPIPSGFVPEGISLWELGTELQPKGKADEDYEKRTLDPEGYNCADCTFVFVTPRFWNKKDIWLKQRLAEGKWKDIRVYDSSNLEQWLDITAAVSRWFSAYLSKYPHDGVITIEEFWKEWSLGPLGALPPEIVTAGRSLESAMLQTFLNEGPGIKAVQAASKDEATAFIIAAANEFDAHNKSRFMSRTLIVDTSGNFRSVRINTRSLNLIARFDEPQILYAAAADGHHVIVPLGPDDTVNQEAIKLPIIDRDGQIKALTKMGLAELDAEKMSREAGRNVTILKRLLQFPQFKLSWLRPESVREIIPALLIGRWHDRKKGDQKLIEIMAGMSYADYTQTAGKWQLYEETPIIKIGELWRLLSPLDAWTNLAAFVTRIDIDLLGEVFLTAFKSGNPAAIAVNDSQRIIFEFNKEKTYSEWAREGIIQSLILVGLYGSNLKLAGIGDSQYWVDSIIRTLLDNGRSELWISLDREMPLLAEASPEQFLHAVNKSLNSNAKEILAVFIEEDGFLHKNSHHTGLLWALESLSWLPEYVEEATLILAKLAANDPGGQLSNRPISSLAEIFKPWHYQTLAGFDERVAAITSICEVVPDVGWQLLLTLLPDYHAIAHPTHKMRWRVFEFNFNLEYTYQDAWEMHHTAVGLLISLFDGTDSKLAELLDKSVDLSVEDRQSILSLAKTSAGTLRENGLKSWKEIRSILSQHRSHPDTDWALPSNVLNQYQELFDLFTPQDSIEQYKWLFDDWPDFPEGNSFDERHDQKVVKRRAEAVEEILKTKGLEQVIELSTKVKEPWSLGTALANVMTDDSAIQDLVLKVDFSNDAQLRFIQNFLGFEREGRGLKWVQRLYFFMAENDFSTKALSELLIALAPSNELWDFIETLPTEIKDYYWMGMRPWFYRSDAAEKIRGLNMLIHYNRFFTAINQAGYAIDDVPSTVLVELLEGAATREASENGRFDYHLDKLLDAMETREDIDHDKKVRLEWMYMPVLGGNSSKRAPENLHAELSNSPEFFVEVLTWLYMPKNRDKISENIEGLTPEMVMRRAESARKLLNSWKGIPGSKQDGAIDAEYLNKWVTSVRELAVQVDREEVADGQIGQIFAKYPEKSELWPPEPIALLIEKLNSEPLNRNFSSGLFNKRGSSTRGAFDGGNIERGHAAYFTGLFELHKNKHKKLSKIFKGLADQYLAHARQMDEEAERLKLEH
jgi:hypothetical protein